MHRHANITKHVSRQLSVCKNLMNCVPAVAHSIQLEEVIFASVAAYFELGTDPVSGTCALCLTERLDDVSFVVVEGHSPLIQLRCCNHCEFFMHLENFVLISYYNFLCLRRKNVGF